MNSGATYHYCRHRDWFDSFTPVTGQSVNMGDGGRVPVLGRGSIRAYIPISDSRAEGATFTDVYFAPDLTVNLLSVAAIIAKGFFVSFCERVCTIRDRQKKVAGRAVQVTNKLYRLSLSQALPRGERASASGANFNATTTTVCPRALTAASPAKPDSAHVRETLSLFHSRFGHASYDSVRNCLQST